MQCKGCKYPDSHVVQSYKDDIRDMVIRRRECLRCGARFTTHEKQKEPKQNDSIFPRRVVR